MTSADRGFVPQGRAQRARRAPRALPYAAGLLALALAAGCTSGTPAPSASSTGSVTPSSSATTTAAPTTTTATATPSVDPVIAKIPAAARPETEAGAVAFVRYFLDQVNEAFVGPEPSALADLYESSCQACTAFLDGARELQADGLRHKGISVTTTEASIDEYSEDRRTVAIGVVQNSVPVVTSSGKKVRSTQAGSGTFLATLLFRGHWIVTNLQVVK